MNIFWLDLLFLNCNLDRIVLLLLILFQTILFTLSLSFKFISCIYDSWILPSTMICCYTYVQTLDVFLSVGLNTTFPVPSFPQWCRVEALWVFFCLLQHVHWWCPCHTPYIGNHGANTLCGYILPLLGNTILEHILWSSD